MNKPLDYVDSFLGLLGLARRSRANMDMVFPAATFVAIGALIGAGVGLMFAPSSGRRLRQDVGDRFDQVKNRLAGEARRHGIVNATSPSQQ